MAEGNFIENMENFIESMEFFIDPANIQQFMDQNNDDNRSKDGINVPMGAGNLVNRKCRRFYTNKFTMNDVARDVAKNLVN